MQAFARKSRQTKNLNTLHFIHLFSGLTEDMLCTTDDLKYKEIPTSLRPNINLARYKNGDHFF